jgi:hypothetical protein
MPSNAVKNRVAQSPSIIHRGLCSRIRFSYQARRHQSLRLNPDEVLWLVVINNDKFFGVFDPYVEGYKYADGRALPFPFTFLNCSSLRLVHTIPFFQSLLYSCN